VEQHDIQRAIGSQYICRGGDFFGRHVVDVGTQHVQMLGVNVLAMMVVFVAIHLRLAKNYSQRVQLAVDITCAGAVSTP
jgi:hypothetical protein